MASLLNNLRIRRLILTASEVKSLSGWPDALVEDYLGAIETIIEIAEALDDTITIVDEVESVEVYPNQSAGDGRSDDASIIALLSDVKKRLDKISTEVFPAPSQRTESPEFYGSTRRSPEQDQAISSRVGRHRKLKVENLTFGSLITDQLNANTNSPPATTSYELPVYAEDGTIIGYIPVYGSSW